MMFRTFASLLLVVVTSDASAAVDITALKDAIHQASNNIEENVDLGKINDALYEQLRPRANVTNMELSRSEVDAKVREYVEKHYAPVLIDNYSTIYGELRAANMDFTNCKKPEPFNPASDVLKALCIEKNGEAVDVRYITNGYSQGWSDTLDFRFEIEEGKATLTEVVLQLREDVKVHIPEI
jgi:hypothetical protein